MSIDSKETNSDKGLIERLFQAGAHFGFTKSRRHPTAAPYLFGNKQGTDIIDLEKTTAQIEEAKRVLREGAESGKTILFVGTKAEVAKIVKEAAQKAMSPYMVNRWIGGTLTNFSEMKKRLGRFKELTEQGESGELERKYTKKERVVIGREHNKLSFNFEGIVALEGMPHFLVVVDPRHNEIAIEEANRLGIPVVGVTSSDYNLKNITYPVLVNDSLQSSVSLVLDELCEAIAAGKKERTEQVSGKKEEKKPE